MPIISFQTEARLLAILGHLFTNTQTIPKLKDFLKKHKKFVPIVPSLGQSYLAGHGHRPQPQQYEEIEYFPNENLQILWEYFEVRRKKFGLDFKTFDTMMSWKYERMEGQKYIGKKIFDTYRLINGCYPVIRTFFFIY